MAEAVDMGDGRTASPCSQTLSRPTPQSAVWRDSEPRPLHIRPIPAV